MSTSAYQEEPEPRTPWLSRVWAHRRTKVGVFVAQRLGSAVCAALALWYAIDMLLWRGAYAFLGVIPNCGFDPSLAVLAVVAAVFKAAMVLIDVLSWSYAYTGRPVPEHKVDAAAAAGDQPDDDVMDRAERQTALLKAVCIVADTLLAVTHIVLVVSIAFVTVELALCVLISALCNTLNVVFLWMRQWDHNTWFHRQPKGSYREWTLLYIVPGVLGVFAAIYMFTGPATLLWGAVSVELIGTAAYTDVHGNVVASPSAALGSLADIYANLNAMANLNAPPYWPVSMPIDVSPLLNVLPIDFAAYNASVHLRFTGFDPTSSGVSLCPHPLPDFDLVLVQSYQNASYLTALRSPAALSAPSLLSFKSGYPLTQVPLPLLGLGNSGYSADTALRVALLVNGHEINPAPSSSRFGAGITVSQPLCSAVGMSSFPAMCINSDYGLFVDTPSTAA